MKHEDLIKKLENLKTPEIELPGHKQTLKMVLLSSERFKKRTIMDWTKILAPIAAAVLLIAVVGFAVNKPESVVPFEPANLGENQISKFASYEDLQEFVKENTQNKAYFGMPGLVLLDIAPGVIWRAGAESHAAVPAAITDYSPTNIQVAGVDEADIVKTDGEYIYLVSGQKVIIVKAYPPEQAQVLSEIKLQGTVIGIFINGDRLVVFEEETPYYPYYDLRLGPAGEIYMPSIAYYTSPKTYIKVYDVSDRENPRLQRELSADGQYVSSRMIGDYAYVVINEPVYGEDDEPSLPRIYSGGNEKEIPATDIYCCNVSDYYYMYTTIMAINTQ
ncbi:MAG TPA: beta-propeller domain-containing protein, partial [Dehalococcoidia bacterium]|nr:beta-propeller domain-containing protein [Dehalococcoidia bacterium]